MTIVTKFGLNFEIDTMDWINGGDAQACEQLLVEVVEGWSKEFARDFHRLSKEAVEGNVDWDHPILEKGEADASDAAATILRTYESWPNEGHNSSIVGI